MKNKIFNFCTNLTTEEMDRNEKKDEIKIEGVMIKAKMSRNGVTYPLKELHDARVSGNTISVGHDEDVRQNVGFYRVIPSEDGLNYEGVIKNTEYNPGIVDMIQKGLVKHVSIEAIAQEVEEDGEDIIVKGLDFTGLGLVKTPGFAEASVAIAEAFNKEKAELTKLKGEEMAEEDKKTPEEKEEKEETPKPKEESYKPVVEEIKKLAEKLDAQKELVEKIDALEKKLDEKEESKGKVTETADAPKYKLVKINNAYRPGKVDFYAEDPEY